MRFLRSLALAVVGFVVLALLIDAFVGVFQPVVATEETEGVLRTFDEKGDVHESRLVVFDDDGTLWIHSGHYFRGWYHRLVDNPEVELLYRGELRSYRAVPVDTPETEAFIQNRIKRNSGELRFHLIRTILLFADMKPVRLDPRGSVPGVRGAGSTDSGQPARDQSSSPRTSAIP